MATVCDRLSRQMETYRETTMEGLCNRISSIKKKDDIFLFKASRSMRLELAMKKTFPYAYLKDAAGLCRIWQLDAEDAVNHEAAPVSATGEAYR